MKIKFGISKKILFSYLSIVIPLVVFIVISYQDRYRERFDTAKSAQINIAKLSATNLELLIREIAEHQKATATTIVDARYPPRIATNYLKTVISPLMNSIVFLNPSGKVLAASDPILIGKDFSSLKHIQKVIQGTEWAISDFLLQDNKPTSFAIVTGIKREGKLAGLVHSGISFNSLQAALSDKSSKVDFLFIKDSKNQSYQLYKNPKPSRITNLPKNWQKISLVKEATKNKIFASIISIKGEKYLGAEVPLKSFGWSIVSLTSFEQEAATILREARQSAILAGLIIFVVLTLSLITLQNNVINPLRILAKKAQTIGEGHFEESTRIKNNDEIGILAKSLGQMRTRLREMVNNLTGIIEISQTVSSSLDLGTVEDRVIKQIRRNFDAQAVGIMLFNPQKNYLEVHRCWGLEKNFEGLKFQPKEGTILKVLSEQEPALMDCQTEPNFPFKEEAIKAGLKNAIIFPLLIRNEVIGILIISSPLIAPDQIPEREVSLLSAFAAQVAIAIENARLYQKQSGIAQTLQQSFLPKEIPKIKGLEIGVSYTSATAAAKVGGDFYDFIPFSPYKTAIIIGDACGKGIEAASLTAQAKNIIRAFAFEDPSPASVLTRANRVIQSQSVSSEFITLIYLVFDGVKKELSYTNGGHPPPAIFRPQDGVAFLKRSSVALGIWENRKYDEQIVQLQPGDKLILYTDGLIEARKKNEELFGEERLQRAITKYSSGGAAELAENILSLVKKFCDGHFNDDVAIVVLELK